MTENQEIKKTDTKTTYETLKESGADLFEKLKQLVKEGNIRSVIVKDRDGNIVANFPVTFGVLGLFLAPWLGLIAVVVGMYYGCTVMVEKK